MNDKSLMTLKQALKSVEQTVEKCRPLITTEIDSFAASFEVAQGIAFLREMFLKNPEIRKAIENMQNRRLGFVTDRSPKAIARAKANGKDLKPYTYEEIIEPCIEALINGYRLTNNEFNVIAGNFYPAKAGKYRKIVEYPGITNFSFTVTPPVFEGSDYAKVRCFASWRKDGRLQTFGTSNRGKEDTQVVKVKINKNMGEDAIIGKAQSKMFTRILERMQGVSMPESTDLELGETGEPITLTAGAEGDYSGESDQEKVEREFKERTKDLDPVSLDIYVKAEAAGADMSVDDLIFSAVTSGNLDRFIEGFLSKHPDVFRLRKAFFEDLKKYRESLGSDLYGQIMMREHYSTEPGYSITQEDEDILKALSIALDEKLSEDEKECQ